MLCAQGAMRADHHMQSIGDACDELLPISDAPDSVVCPGEGHGQASPQYLLEV